MSLIKSFLSINSTKYHSTNYAHDDIDLQSSQPTAKRKKLSHNAVGLDKYSQSNQEIILNVGGIKYHTTIQTLTGYQSMLKARFSSKYSIQASQDGTYFIDRNGKLFEYILEYLRNGRLILPSIWNKDDIWKFYIEIKYFIVESLFDQVLLKLFNSEIMKNNSLKLQIISKIGEILKWNKNEIMESLNQWKLLKLHTNSLHNRIAHSLRLVTINYQIYGLFLTTYTKNNKWYWRNSESFAFCCGQNSVHLFNDKDINIEFRNVRRLTNDENTNNDFKDKIRLYKDYLPLYPFAARVYTENFQNHVQVKFYHIDSVKAEYQTVRNQELWSIPI